MTLPFRRRHNDAEASHDRARALIANGFTTPNEPADVTWLDEHMAGCAECAADLAAYTADRELLRALRDHAPEPPRDLWARTAAAIEQDHARRAAGRECSEQRDPGESAGSRLAWHRACSWLSSSSA